MILFFENNINLYRTEKKYYEKSLQIAKDLPNSIDEYMNFHLFWRVPGEFGFKQAAAIKSIIVSHKNKLDLITINLWSNVDLRVNEYFKEISRYVNFKIWNLTEEIKNTVLENCHFLQEYNLINDNLCYLESDLFRLLVLHKYGGFYIDMDVLVLRDLSPLNSYEFLYQWGATGFKCFHYNIVNKLRLNNAIMRLNKNSDLSLEFLEILSKTYPEKNSNNWGSVLFLKTNRKFQKHVRHGVGPC